MRIAGRQKLSRMTENIAVANGITVKIWDEFCCGSCPITMPDCLSTLVLQLQLSRDKIVWNYHVVAWKRQFLRLVAANWHKCKLGIGKVMYLFIWCIANDRACLPPLVSQEKNIEKWDVGAWKKNCCGSWLTKHRYVEAQWPAIAPRYTVYRMQGGGGIIMIKFTSQGSGLYYN